MRYRMNSKCSIHPRRVAVWPALASLAVVLSAGPAQAYIGPGASVGAIVTAVAVLLGILFLFVGLLWYPIKRMLKGKSGATKAEAKEDTAA